MLNSGCQSSKTLSKQFPSISFHELKSDSALTLANHGGSESKLSTTDFRSSTRLRNNSDSSLSAKSSRKSLRSVDDLKSSKEASSSRKKCLESARVLNDVDKKSNAVNAAVNMMSRISSKVKQSLLGMTVTFDKSSYSKIAQRSSTSVNRFLRGDKMVFNDSDLTRMGSQVHQHTFTVLSTLHGTPNLKSISKCDRQKVTKISFEKSRVHYGYPYDGLEIHPPRFASGYQTVTNPRNGDTYMIPNYVQGVLTYDGIDRHHAKFRCESMNDLITNVRELKDCADANCKLYEGH